MIIIIIVVFQDLLVTSSLRMVKLDPKESQESKAPRDPREPEAPLESEDPVDSREIHALLAKRPKKEKRVTKVSTAYPVTQELPDRQDQKELKGKMENLDLREKLVHKDPRYVWEPLKSRLFSWISFINHM